MADWLTIIETAAATGLGVSIGNEVFNYFKNRKEKIKAKANAIANQATSIIGAPNQYRVNDFVRRETEI